MKTSKLIALLVLRYLERHQCKVAAEELKKESRHLKRVMTERCSVGGARNLEDMIREYSEMITIIDESLTKKNLYNMETSIKSFPGKLIYLLESNTGFVASTSTSSEDDVSSGDTTPEDNLPGNRTERRNLDIRDVSEVFARSFLENHELHEVIAETINTEKERNKSNHEVVKNVVEKTENMYNQIIDEIMGDFSPNTKEISGRVEAQNNEAISSIVNAAQHHSDNVYVFDGSFDTYLKTNASAPVFALPEHEQKGFTGSNGLEQACDIMSLPTIIVNDNENEAKLVEKKLVQKPFVPVRKITRLTAIPCDCENGMIQEKEPKKLKTMLPKSQSSESKSPKEPLGEAPSPIEPQQKQTRRNSHVRNLDFSTPLPGTKSAGSWDADLRALTQNCARDKTPPKRSREKKKAKGGKTPVVKPDVVNTEPTAPKTPEISEVSEALEPPATPKAAIVDKELPIDDSTTPFSQVLQTHLDEQLSSIDLMSLETPNLPITPGYGLGSTDVINRRTTDYSTSSSYYQPSDTEQNLSMEKLLKECNKSSDKQRVEILSDVIINNKASPDKKNSIKTKFMHNVIGRKNLNLLSPVLATSSSGTSDDENTSTTKAAQVTIISSEKEINEILKTTEIKLHLKTKPPDNSLAETRERTIQSIKKEILSKRKNPPGRRVKTPRVIPMPQPKRSRGRPRKLVDPPPSPPQSEPEEKDLVKGLAQRGILLMPKVILEKPVEQPVVDEAALVFKTKLLSSPDLCVKYKVGTVRKEVQVDTELLKRQFSAQMYSEEYKTDVISIVQWTQFTSLLEMPLQGAIDNDLMDFACSGKVEKSPVKVGRKRKVKGDDWPNPEKKGRLFGAFMKKKVDVDQFLDKLHK